MSNQLMAGKRGLIMGLANDKSIAWGIAKALSDAGADLAFSYQGEALKKRVDPLAAQLGSDIVLPCDVGDEGSIDALFAELRIFSSPVEVSAQNWNANVVDGAVAPLLLLTIAAKWLLISARTVAPSAFAIV